MEDKIVEPKQEILEATLTQRNVSFQGILHSSTNTLQADQCYGVFGLLATSKEGTATNGIKLKQSKYCLGS